MGAPTQEFILRATAKLGEPTLAAKQNTIRLRHIFFVPWSVCHSPHASHVLLFDVLPPMFHVGTTSVCVSPPRAVCWPRRTARIPGIGKRRCLQLGRVIQPHEDCHADVTTVGP